VLRGPATLALATYVVREQDGEIQVRIERGAVTLERRKEQP
jgi:hypothetical protein